MSEDIQAPPVITIKTPRLVLTTLQMSDLDEVMPLITDFEIMKWTSRPPVQDLDQGRTWLSARALGSPVFNFAIRELSPSTHEVLPHIVGILGAVDIATCGYIIASSYAGKGYASEALRAFIPAYFEHVPPASESGTGHDILDAFTDTTNFASHRVLEKCGFVKCETLENEFENWHFGTRDTIVWRYSRPGSTLEGLRNGSMTGARDDGDFVPPVQ
ncbi:hypothetical protein TI39_contig4192g00002 [Zymoseptoria brevis]|uniref:N-acetyltransferase domain-containing protein n=1 Tax=Zymoseptoria brevis TaxID=1047168 RepID=A0A0F4GE49_9PEZI|nr:hypothetical protein TI39_contig4192g00002 [Zymoseptoria brevis]